MADDKKAQETTVEPAPVDVETNNAQQESNDVLSYEQKIKNLIVDGWRRKNGMKIRNVIVTEKETYCMMTFNVVPAIPGYLYDEQTGEYVKGMTNNIFSSTYAVAGVMKENEEIGWLANNIIEKPKLGNVLFNGGTIDIITKEFTAGDVFQSPFGNGEEQVFDHDCIINLVVGIQLGNNGRKMLDSIRGSIANQLFDL